MKKILAWILPVLLCLGGCGLASGASERETEMTYAELAEIFEKYGISGTTPQIIEELEQADQIRPPEIELDKAAQLLTVLGRGDYDYEDMTWAPYENGVYAFDLEVFDVGKMYTDFLNGISALDRKELDFQEIQEDTSQVNWEEGTGKRTVTFLWENEPFTLETKENTDWFDMDVAYQLNQIIREHGKEKQLFFAGDGYQEIFVFYREKDWADAFSKETGLELTE